MVNTFLYGSLIRLALEGMIEMMFGAVIQLMYLPLITSPATNFISVGLSVVVLLAFPWLALIFLLFFELVET